MAILLTAVRGVGPAAAKNLTEHGITSVEELASISVTSLCQVPGYGTITAQRIIASAKALLAQDWQADIEGRKVKPKAKAKGKNRKKKSGKKKRKTNKQESVMAKKNSKKVKSLKKEIKSRKSKVAKQDKKIKSLKKAVKKAS